MNKQLMDYCTELGMKVENAMENNKSVKELHDEITAMCIECFTDYYPTPKEQLEINFINVNEDDKN